MSSPGTRRSRTKRKKNRMNDVFKLIGDRVEPTEVIRGILNSSHKRRRPIQNTVLQSYFSQSSNLPGNSKDIFSEHLNTSSTSGSQSQSTANSSIKNDSSTAQQQFPPSQDGQRTFMQLSVANDVGARLTLESYREQIHEMLMNTKRYDLLPLLHRRCTEKVRLDPIEQHFLNSQNSMSASPTTSTSPTPATKRNLRPRRAASAASANRLPTSSTDPTAPKVSCEVKMRVRIQYKSHQHVLSLIHSHKNGKEERQFDKFFQATSVLRARDTGCVVCDISFSDVMYLGAFWRDYINGSLQDALKSIFLNEMRRHTPSDEELDVFVSVDEHDFKIGQSQLLQHLKQNGPYLHSNKPIYQPVTRSSAHFEFDHE